MPAVDTQSVPPSSFSVETSEIVGRLRGTITNLFRDYGGIRKSYDVQKLLGIDTRLSWQLFKLAGPGDSLSLAPHVPTAAGIKRLLHASRAHKIDPVLLQNLRSAHEEFERLIATYAGDRTSFDSMTRAYAATDDAHQTDMLHRKAIFKGYSHFLGTQMETFLTTMIIYPGAAPRSVNFGFVRGQYGLRRLRPDADLIVDSSRIAGVDRELMLRASTFDPVSAALHGTAILPQFCTQPLPQLRSSLQSNGETNISLQDELLGSQSAANMVFGTIWKDKEINQATGEPLRFGPTMRIRHPAALLVADVLIHAATFPHVTESVRVNAHAAAMTEKDVLEGSQPALPFPERVTRITGTLDNARIREVPQYLDVLSYLLNYAQMDFDDFNVYRLCLEYPLIDSMISIFFRVDPNP